MIRPRLLDLFCGAGGASMGYTRAGWDVYGVDIIDQPNYPFWFYKADAMTFDMSGFDAIHASPPCQAYSDLAFRTRKSYPELIEPTRERLQASGVPYVIENVEGAPLLDPVVLCGTMFEELYVIRHRLFESNIPFSSPPEHGSHPLTFTYDKRKNHFGHIDQSQSYVQVTGRNYQINNGREAMGIPWMKHKLELNEAVPPAYAQWIGQQLIESR